MTFIDFLNNNTIWAWIIIGFVSLGLVSYFLIGWIFKDKKKQHEIIDWDALKEDVEKQKQLDMKPNKKIKVVKEKKIELLKDTEIESYTLPRKEGSLYFLKFKYINEWFKHKYYPHDIVLIHMELETGFFRLFTVKQNDSGFVFRRKKYLFSGQNKVYNTDAKLYEFFYHENIVLPISLKIPVDDIKKTMESTEGIDIEYALNPSTLQRFLTAKIAEGVMKSSQIDEFMRKLQTFIIVIMVAVLIHFALFLYASGILQNIKVGGLF